MKRHISAALRNWFRSLSSVCRSPVARPHRHQGRRPGARPQLEELESRLAPTANVFLASGVLHADSDNSGNTIALFILGTNTVVSVNNELPFHQFPTSAINSIQINGGTGFDHLMIDGTLSPTTVTGHGSNDSVVVGDGFNMHEVRAQVTVTASSGSVALTIDASHDNDNQTLQLGASSLTGITPSNTPINYSGLNGLIVLTTNGNNTVTVNDTPHTFAGLDVSTNIYTGTGAETVNVLATSGRSLNLHGNSPNTTVFVGNNGSLAGIQSVGISISNLNGDTGVVIDDHNRGGTRTATIDTGTSDVQYMQVSGLAAATIYSQRASTRDVDVYTGTGAVTVNVLATWGHGLNLHGNSATTAVVVGNNGNLDGIQGLEMSISNLNGDTGVVIDDRNRGGTRTAIFDTGTSDVQFVQLTALIPGSIYLQRANTRDVDVYTGTGAVSVNVLATWGHGLNLHANSVNTTVNVGSNGNSLDNIQAPVLVDGGATLNVNDQGTITDKSYVINADAVKRFINVDQGTYDAVVTYGNIGTLTINGSGSNGINGNDVFFVVGTAANTNTTLNGGAVGAGGVNEFVAYAANGLDSLLGPLTTHGRPGTNSYLVYNDILAPTLQTYTLTTNTVIRSGVLSVTFDNLNQVILYVPSVGGNTINVPSLAAGVLDNLSVAGGDTVTIGSNQTVAAVLGQVAVITADNTSATVVIDDSGNPTPLAGPITLSNSPPYGYLISGLIPDGIYLGQGQNTTLNTSLLTGAGDKTFNMQDAPQGVALTLNAGSGTNTLDYTGYAGNVLVDLPLGAATGFSGISNIYNVKGASGGPAGSYNILVGFGGNVLTGGNGRRNLLIAGAASSTLLGGDGEDILIGGTTAYDTNPALLQAIMDYWAGTDDYGTRVANLTGGTGVPLLDATTVTGNRVGNTLNGGSGLDLFYGDLALDTYDWDPAMETFVSV
jgi:hypothetical protein